MSTYTSSEASLTAMSCSSSTQSQLFSQHCNGWILGVAVGFDRAVGTVSLEDSVLHQCAAALQHHAELFSFHCGYRYVKGMAWRLEALSVVWVRL